MAWRVLAATFPAVRIIEEALNGLALLEPTVFSDERGVFYESYNRAVFEELTGFTGYFVQDNHSTSVEGVLRGIHYQLPKPQGKLVRCVAGEIWDVAVDLRRSSPTFKEWRGYRLDADNMRQMWIPIGFGHGFVVLSATAQVLYKTTELWDAQCDRAIAWDDADLAIDWPIDERPLVSEKDASAPTLDEVPLFD